MFKSDQQSNRECTDIDQLDKSDKSLANSIACVVYNAIDAENVTIKKLEKSYVLVCKSSGYINLTKLTEALSRYNNSIQDVWVEYERKVLCISVKYDISPKLEIDASKRRTVKASKASKRNQKLADITTAQFDGLRHIKEPGVLSCIKALLYGVIQFQIDHFRLKTTKLTFGYKNAKNLDVEFNNHSHRLDVTELFNKLSIWVAKQPAVNSYVVHVDVNNKSVKLSIDIDPLVESVTDKRKLEEVTERNVVQKV